MISVFNQFLRKFPLHGSTIGVRLAVMIKVQVQYNTSNFFPVLKNEIMSR
jgi:hypothetical protein